MNRDGHSSQSEIIGSICGRTRVALLLIFLFLVYHGNKLIEKICEAAINANLKIKFQKNCCSNFWLFIFCFLLLAKKINIQNNRLQNFTIFPARLDRSWKISKLLLATELISRYKLVFIFYLCHLFRPLKERGNNLWQPGLLNNITRLSYVISRSELVYNVADLSLLLVAFSAKILISLFTEISR